MNNTLNWFSKHIIYIEALSSSYTSQRCYKTSDRYRENKERFRDVAEMGVPMII